MIAFKSIDSQFSMFTPHTNWHNVDYKVSFPTLFMGSYQLSNLSNQDRFNLIWRYRLYYNVSPNKHYQKGLLNKTEVHSWSSKLCMYIRGKRQLREDNLHSLLLKNPHCSSFHSFLSRTRSGFLDLFFVSSKFGIKLFDLIINCFPSFVDLE